MTIISPLQESIIILVELLFLVELVQAAYKDTSTNFEHQFALGGCNRDSGGTFRIYWIVKAKLNEMILLMP
jgi:hypothetical protein